MLELVQVHTFRGPAHILQGLSLVVHEREVVCLVGRNGAGKTTTIESIMGLLPIRSGTITLQGRDITRLPTHTRAGLGMGYAPEGSAIFPELTVAENLQISQWLAAQKGRGQAADDAMEARIFALFAEVVKQIKAMGISVLIAESNLVNATKVADRLYAIDRGEIIFEGSPQAVFDNAEVIK